MNDPLAERYYALIKEKVKEDYYWEQKVKNLISEEVANILLDKHNKKKNIRSH